MKLLLRLVVAAIITLTPVLAWANCTTSSITLPDGKFVMCITCCQNGSCNTTCF